MLGENVPTLAFKPVNMLEVQDLIRMINLSRSAANDDISMKLLKKIQEPLLPVILHLINTTIITTQYPNPLKCTKIIPLLKKGKDPTLTKSYRGVNLIPSLAKIIDRALLSQLLSHLERSKLIPH